MRRQQMKLLFLRLEMLEDRLTPTISFDFDYTFDTTGFFADPVRREALERVGADIASRIASTPSAIIPSGTNTWTATFFNPATGHQVGIDNLVVPEGVLKVFVGARQLEGTQAALGGYGGYRASGYGDWNNTVATRGQAFSVWGGSLTFDIDQNWYFDADPSGLRRHHTDFYTVTTHELGHLLGLGTSPAFNRWIGGGVFTGPNATAVFGSHPPVAADGAHWAPGVESGGQPASLQPYLVTNIRYGLSPLDYAALADIGWQVTSFNPTVPPVAVPPVVSPPTPPQDPIDNEITPTPTPPTTPPLPSPPGDPAPGGPSETEADPLLPRCKCGVCSGCAVFSGVTGGTLQLFDLSQPGQAIPSGDPIHAFPGFHGVVRAVTADVNRDGVPDIIAVTGPGGGSRIRVIDGKDGTDLLPIVSVFEPSYTGGLFVAAADLTGDGHAEIIVSPDRGGGGRVTVLKVAGGSAQILANFFGIEDVAFRGGARVAAADVNGDGIPDIVVGAGYGGGPRVAIFDGATLTTTPRKLVPDFFAFDGPDALNLRNGVFPAAGDLDGDGKADLVFGGGPGGGPRVFVLSGALVMTSVDWAKQRPLANFFAFDAFERGGVRPFVKDVTRNGQPDLVVGSGEGMSPRIKVYFGGASRWTGADPLPVSTLAPFGSIAAADGVYVG
jgi:hypothetical protein